MAGTLSTTCALVLFVALWIKCTKERNECCSTAARQLRPNRLGRICAVIVSDELSCRN
jgi:hypothetical protein